MTENQVKPQEDHLTTIFAVRTTIGRERAVQELIFNRLRTINPIPDLKAILTSEQYRGYVFIEAIHQRDVLNITNGVPHVKGKVVGSIPFDSILHVIKPEKIINIMEEGDIVEVTSGIFQNNKAKIIKMPKDKEGAREDVTVRLIDSDSPITVKIHADYLKLFEKTRKVTKEYVVSSSTSEESEEVESVEFIESSEISRETTEEDQKEPESKEARVVYSEEEVSQTADDTFSFEDETDIDEEEEIAESSDDEDDFEEEISDSEEEEEDDWAKFMD